jgi:hypothetical protein
MCKTILVVWVLLFVAACEDANSNLGPGTDAGVDAAQANGRYTTFKEIVAHDWGNPQGGLSMSLCKIGPRSTFTLADYTNKQFACAAIVAESTGTDQGGTGHACLSYAMLPDASAGESQCLTQCNAIVALIDSTALSLAECTFNDRIIIPHP